MTLCTTEIFDALVDAGVPTDKAMTAAVALTRQPPGSSHKPVIGDIAVYAALRDVGVSEERARACAVSLVPHLT
jgi:hypothetical protein